MLLVDRQMTNIRDESHFLVHCQNYKEVLHQHRPREEQRGREQAGPWSVSSLQGVRGGQEVGGEQNLQLERRFD